MIIINSGAYVVSEFQAELGRIPPCMLPISNRKLIELQVSVLQQQLPQEKIYVTLPESYLLTLNEEKLLQELNVTPLRTCDEFTLSESILYALNVSIFEPQDEKTYLFHGDTLISDLSGLSHQNDVIGVAHSLGDYHWQFESNENDSILVWCGLFIFSNRHQLIRSLALSRGDFVAAIQHYRQQYPLTLVNIENWCDLGHVNTYFRSRAAITTQRAFNSLKIEQSVLTKTGQPDVKIQAESNWFSCIPASLRRFIPQLIDKGVNANQQSFYQLEFLPIMPLNELFVHGRNPANEWRKIFNHIDIFFKSCLAVPIPFDSEEAIHRDFLRLMTDKTFSRLKKYSDMTGYSLDQPVQYGDHQLPSVKQIAEKCIQHSSLLEKIPAVMHGDLCFSNILFDSRADLIKVIDPRGISADGVLSIYGDQKYDLAKLAHSVIGLYDFIIAGRYKLVEYDQYHTELDFELDDRIESIQSMFMDYSFLAGIRVKEIMPIVVLLFLSMLPLHHDRPDRQRAMLANAIRLYHQTAVSLEWPQP